MNPTVLVCDDDREIAAAVDIYLTAEGYTVLQAHDGLEAIDTVEKHPEIELILMDIMMPRLDGVRATMKIRETHNIPIVMLSAKGEDNDKILGLNIGADDYITKPFNPMELIYENVWNEPSYGADNIVAVHIRHIREKIEINPKEPRYIKVIWGHGYKMEKLS